MDSDYVSDGEGAEAQAMAAAMGFSSFGSHKPPAKRRKFNATTDAFVEGQELASLDKGGKKGKGSGGNTIPLGKARVFGSFAAVPVAPMPVVGNRDEINLGEDEGEEDGPAYIDTSLPAPADQLDVTKPPAVSGEEVEEVQARIDALLASLGPTHEPSSSILPSSVPDIPPRLPQPPPPGLSNKPPSWSSSSRPQQRGQKNKHWYIGYYDPSFNENPWERLEKEKGLQPLCTWPENVGRKV